MQPGRHCPLHYRYAPAALALLPAVEADTVYAVGGLYGNVPALEAVLDLAVREHGRVTIVFNGDFHWFDVDDAAFATINREVLRWPALRGNVETQIAGEDEGAGCGCAYPDWVADDEVARSNAISSRLRDTARRFPAARAVLAALPMYLVVRVGGLRVGIVHGDAHSLAGWGYAQERFSDEDMYGTLARDFADSNCRVIASSHTCLPIATDCLAPHGRCVLINNGAAGMPNFRGTRHGVISRISVNPSAQVVPLYTTRLEGIHVEALPVDYDHARWRRAFLANWPADSPAHESYFRRIEEGPPYALACAARWRELSGTDAATAAMRESTPT